MNALLVGSMSTGVYRTARREFSACLKEVVGFHYPAATDVSAECRALLEQLA